MIPQNGQGSVTIPAALFLAPSGNESRSSRSVSTEGSLNLRELVGECARRGRQSRTSVVGLDTSNREVESTRIRLRPRINWGSRLCEPGPLEETSEGGPSVESTLQRLQQFAHEGQIATPYADDQQTYPLVSIAEVYRSLGEFSFPTTATISKPKEVLRNPKENSEICPLDFAPHKEEPPSPRSRRTSRFSIANTVRRFSVMPSIFASSRPRNSTLHNLFEHARKVERKMHRSINYQKTFEYGFYTTLLAALYFILVGMPLWKGLIWCLYIFLSSQKFVLEAGFVIFVGPAFLYAFTPLLIKFESDNVPTESDAEAGQPDMRPGVETCSLLIPCYKSESLIAATLEAALKVFPSKNIFVIANGNSLTPLDNTAVVCETFGVNHIWCPIGSKIIAQFLGSYAAKSFPYTLLIDDDCLLPPNFPIMTNRIKGRIKCLGYTIKSVGPGRQPGTLCQQAQDIEYKLSGLQRAFAGKVGSATFPHGAIALWDRELLIKTFHCHPGFSISEDWFFGHVARTLGSRIIMCTQVFVETETPPAIFWVNGGEARGGFGEMTIYKQRFYRWNFFFVNDIYWNMRYILFSWKLGWWEIGAKIFVWQEVYETIIFLLTPFIFPISLFIRPRFCAILFAATFALYFVNVIIFNEVHLRWKGETVSWMAIIYYMPYKIILFVVNVLSCYYSIYKYAKYFAKRHPKVVHDKKVIEVILDFVEQPDKRDEHKHNDQEGKLGGSHPVPTITEGQIFSSGST